MSKFIWAIQVQYDLLILFPPVFKAPTPSPSPNPCAVKCKSGTCVSSTKVCDFVNDCGSGDNSDEQNCGDCTFEQGEKPLIYD